MPSEQPPAEQQPIVITDVDVDEAIAACGGDAREAIRTLLIAGQFMRPISRKQGKKRVGVTSGLGPRGS
ncbi:hypothetical protein J2X65_003465 [Ancylobacter sp. 3268]|uniref:hypothetical protein n=1 Tax=Ancylobacter sp. 3268 TaxID=2817752 RepID=UPI00285C04D3|nr:hypothetical protein [Ancylobacter sp. 3268]MDR6954097.1 hypothetical protein [Ancylobacter sp. 3268]